MGELGSGVDDALRPAAGAGGGIAYMLQGDMGREQYRPVCDEGQPGQSLGRVACAHHGAARELEDLDSMSDDPKSGGPWVMWKGTPYAHLMVPVSRTAAPK